MYNCVMHEPGLQLHFLPIYHGSYQLSYAPFLAVEVSGCEVVLVHEEWISLPRCSYTALYYPQIRDLVTRLVRLISSIQRSQIFYFARWHHWQAHAEDRK